MLAFIDESGDPGFKVPKGSSPVFVAAMAIFDDMEAAQATEAVIKQAREDLRVKPEFKFSKCADPVRDGFFRAVDGCRFSVRAIVVKKALIYSPHLRGDKENFYKFFVQQMLWHDNDTLDRAKVIIDGSGDREFRKTLQSYLRRRLGPRLRSVKFSNSRNDPLVQLADMCAGAIARSYRTDRGDRWRWHNMLRPKLDDVWDFR